MAIQFMYEYDGFEHIYVISLAGINNTRITRRSVTTIKRKNANNCRQTSWWKKVVLFRF